MHAQLEAEDINWLEYPVADRAVQCVGIRRSTDAHCVGSDRRPASQSDNWTAIWLGDYLPSVPAAKIVTSFKLEASVAGATCAKPVTWL